MISYNLGPFGVNTMVTIATTFNKHNSPDKTSTEIAQ